MESEVSTDGSSEPLKILSLDGGGIRGISSLLILERIMELIRDVHQLEQVPRPCDHFDLIGGTSTGGIIAIMLGRLGMTVDECIRAYRKLAQQAFTPKRTSILPASPRGAFSAQALENSIKQTVREFCTDGECVTRRRQGHPTTATCPHSDLSFRDQTCTKTVVLAITKSNVDAGPTLFETYDTSAAFDGCTIWQVARATSAATTFFKPIQVGRDAIEFIDAGFGYNNPCDELIREARRIFPAHREPQVLSIGTGLGGVVNIKNTRISIITALKSMATSSQKVATRLDNRYGDSGEYFRFNVDRGLDDITLSDWEQASTISAHTRNYLSEKSRAIKKFVDVFTRSALSGALSVGRPGVEPSQPAFVKTVRGYDACQNLLTSYPFWSAELQYRDHSEYQNWDRYETRTRSVMSYFSSDDDQVMNNVFTAVRKGQITNIHDLITNASDLKLQHAMSGWIECHVMRDMSGGPEYTGEFHIWLHSVPDYVPNWDD